MKSKRNLSRRDRLWIAGWRMNSLRPDQAVTSWNTLSAILRDELSQKDVPKFNDLFTAIRRATITGSRKRR